MIDLEKAISEDICELNCWRVPPRLKKVVSIMGDDEIKLALNVLSIYVPYKKWIKTWQAQDGVKRKKKK